MHVFFVIVQWITYGWFIVGFLLLSVALFMTDRLHDSVAMFVYWLYGFVSFIIPLWILYSIINTSLNGPMAGL